MEVFVLQTGPLGVNSLVIKIYKNYVFVVDPGACKNYGDEEEIVSFLNKNNFFPLAILLTHGHFDHITGTAKLKQTFPLVPVVCHEKDSLMCGSKAFDVQKSVLESMGASFILDSLKNLPDANILIKDETNLFNLLSSNLENPVDEELKNALSEWSVLHTPGHTKGSVCYINQKEKILVSGDTVFFHSYGRTDLPGGNDKEMISSLKRIYTTLPKDLCVFPGHDRTGFLLSENE